jgi:acylphosphatase
MTTNVRAHVWVSGRVQGVFFREETRRAAERLNVKGWVRNRSDATVEVLFEGTQQAVNAAIAWCREEGSPRSEVADVQVSWEAYVGEFNAFTIKKTV